MEVLRDNKTWTEVSEADAENIVDNKWVFRKDQ